jgi:hypothetical protein
MLDNQKSIIVLKGKKIVKNIMKESGIKLDRNFMNDKIYTYHMNTFENQENETLFE